MIAVDPKLPEFGTADYDKELRRRLQKVLEEMASELNRKIGSVYDDPVYWMGRNRHNGPDGSGSGFTNPLTTKGDILTEDVTGAIRLAVGSDGQVLTADSAQTAGIKWATPTVYFTDPTTTKGDLIVHGASTTRLAVGTDNQVLTADSAQAAGVKWATPTTGFSDPTTTKGDLIVHGASTTRLAVGTDGQVLTADSAQAAGIKWAAASGSTGLSAVLEQHTASTSATLDFTSWYSSTYDEYLIELVNLIPATSGANCLLRMSTDGGSTYDSGNNYQWAGFRASKAGSAAAGATTTSSIGLDGSGGQTNSSTAGGVCGHFRLFSPASTSLHKRVKAEIGIDDGTANPDVTVMLTGRYTSTTAVNAFRILFSSGNITSGTVRVYGIAK